MSTVALTSHSPARREPVNQLQRELGREAYRPFVDYATANGFARLEVERERLSRLPEAHTMGDELGNEQLEFVKRSLAYVCGQLGGDDPPCNARTSTRHLDAVDHP